MILYNSKGNTVDCHPTQIENMKRKGWTEQPPKPEKSTPKVVKEEK